MWESASEDFTTTVINMFKDIKKKMAMDMDSQERNGNYKKIQNFLEEIYRTKKYLISEMKNSLDGFNSRQHMIKQRSEHGDRAIEITKSEEHKRKKGRG